MLNHGGDERSVGSVVACNRSSLRRVPIDERVRWRNRLLLVADRFIIHRSPPLLHAVLAVIVVNRLTKSSAFSATSLQPASIVRECPRPGILTISVTPLLRFCFLYAAFAIAHGTVWSESAETISIGPRSGLVELTFASVHGLRFADAAWKSGSPGPGTEDPRDSFLAASPPPALAKT